MTKTDEIKPIKRKVKVTAEYEVEIIFQPKLFAYYKDKGINNYVEEYLKDFRKGLWDVEDIDDVAMYAAREAALCGDGEYDGIGKLKYVHSCLAPEADVTYAIDSEDIECEITE